MDEKDRLGQFFDKKERASATSIEMDSVAHYKALVARQSALKPGD